MNRLDIPVEWANTSKHYFENEYGECWISTVQDETLLISGEDIDFEVISLTNKEAISEKKSLLHSLQMNTPAISMGKVVTKSESLWFLSVIESFLNQLKP